MLYFATDLRVWQGSFQRNTALCCSYFVTLNRPRLPVSHKNRYFTRNVSVFSFIRLEGLLVYRSLIVSCIKLDTIISLQQKKLKCMHLETKGTY